MYIISTSIQYSSLLERVTKANTVAISLTSTLNQAETAAAYKAHKAPLPFPLINRAGIRGMEFGWRLRYVWCRMKAISRTGARVNSKGTSAM